MSELVICEKSDIVGLADLVREATGTSDGLDFESVLSGIGEAIEAGGGAPSYFTFETYIPAASGSAEISLSDEVRNGLIAVYAIKKNPINVSDENYHTWVAGFAVDTPLTSSTHSCSAVWFTIRKPNGATTNPAQARGNSDLTSANSDRNVTIDYKSPRHYLCTYSGINGFDVGAEYVIVYCYS